LDLDPEPTCFLGGKPPPDYTPPPVPHVTVRPRSVRSDELHERQKEFRSKVPKIAKTESVKSNHSKSTKHSHRSKPKGSKQRHSKSERKSEKTYWEKQELKKQAVPSRPPKVHHKKGDTIS
jgi:hypothetical protein